MDQRSRKDTKEHRIRQFDEAYRWSLEILQVPQRLGEIVGKAAVSVWLYDEITNFGELQTTFLIALKYFWRRENKNSSNIEEIERLFTTKFRDMSDWAGDTREFRVRLIALRVGCLDERKFPSLHLRNNSLETTPHTHRNTSRWTASSSLGPISNSGIGTLNDYLL